MAVSNDSVVPLASPTFAGDCGEGRGNRLAHQHSAAVVARDLEGEIAGDPFRRIRHIHMRARSRSGSILQKLTRLRVWGQAPRQSYEVYA